MNEVGGTPPFLRGERGDLNHRRKGVEGFNILPPFAGANSNPRLHCFCFIILSFHHFIVSEANIYHFIVSEANIYHFIVSEANIYHFIVSEANISYISSGASIPSIDNQFFKTCFTANTKANAEFELVIFLLVLL
jgi:hypothetical protein